MGKRDKRIAYVNPLAQRSYAPPSGSTIQDYLNRPRPTWDEFEEKLKKVQSGSSTLAAYEEEMNKKFREELKRNREAVQSKKSPDSRQKDNKNKKKKKRKKKRLPSSSSSSSNDDNRKRKSIVRRRNPKQRKTRRKEQQKIGHQMKRDIIPPHRHPLIVMMKDKGREERNLRNTNGQDRKNIGHQVMKMRYSKKDLKHVIKTVNQSDIVVQS